MKLPSAGPQLCGLQMGRCTTSDVAVSTTHIACAVVHGTVVSGVDEMGTVTSMRADEEDTLVLRAACIAPRPKTIAETGFATAFLGDLLEKHLFQAGALTLGAMIKRTALAGPILEE